MLCVNLIHFNSAGDSLNKTEGQIGISTANDSVTEACMIANAIGISRANRTRQISLFFTAGPLRRSGSVQYMFSEVEEDLGKKLIPIMRKYATKIKSLSVRVRFALQTEPHGFQHSVACSIETMCDGETDVAVWLGDGVFPTGHLVRTVLKVHMKNNGKSMVRSTRMTVDKAVSYSVLRTEQENSVY